MVLRRILVIDPSPAVRETVTMVLAGEYKAESSSDTEFFARPQLSTGGASLLILGASDLALINAHRIAPDTRVLWLAPDAQWQAIPAGGRWSSIPRSFVPSELRRALLQLLADPTDPNVAHRLLRYPYLAADIAPVALQALRHRLPICLHGGGRAGARSAVARTIHALTRDGPFVAVPASSFEAEALPSPATPGRRPGTLFIDAVERMHEDAQQALLALLTADGTVRTAGGLSLRLITGTEADLDRLLSAHFSTELYYRMTTWPIRLVPLCNRLQDVPELVRVVSEDLRQQLGSPPVQFTAAALQRLSNYLWFGDVIELEAVLARTLILSPKEVIDAGDLRFEEPRSVASHDLPLPPQPSPSHFAGDELELVINELAHELKNPMVTIKTFAQHLRRVVYSGAEEEQVARLTGEAVDQIDQVLENLIQFTRFDEPHRESVTVASVLGPAVSALAQLLKPRSRRVDYRPPPAVSIFVDREQATYALANLLRAVARGLGDTGRVVISYVAPGTIIVELPTGYDPSDARLSALLDRPPGPAVSLPLLAALARKLIERNGGHISFDAHQQPPTVTVRFPVVEEEEPALVGNGETPRSSR